MKFSNKMVALLLTAMIAIAAVPPAFSQATTLAGSVYQAAPAVKPVPTIRAQRAVYDNRRPVVINRNVYQTGASQPVYYEDRRPYFQKHPKVKSAVVGAGVGAAGGAVAGLVSGRGVLRGAAIGGGTGAGVGLIRSSRTMKRHPLAKDMATGAAVGFGLGAASSRRGSTMVKSAAIGTAVGGGVHFLKKMF
ncbi:MAG: hypothetical protein SGJ27_15250 [Candidatus Melainabacteria bacterium]|nr:hypothetical protein [Candidatus Melainabacteria bacterium]